MAGGGGPEAEYVRITGGDPSLHGRARNALYLWGGGPKNIA